MKMVMQIVCIDVLILPLEGVRIAWLMMLISSFA